MKFTLFCFTVNHHSQNMNVLQWITQLVAPMRILDNFSLLNACRSVDDLTTFYIFRWVNHVFHILLKIWHIVVWLGPNCLGKSTPSFRIYYMIKNMPKYLSHHAFIIVKIYVVNHILWTWPPVVVMFTCCFILCRCLRNVWWFVTHKHPSKQCSAWLSTKIVLTAGYATHVWNYIMSSCRKIHNPYK